MIGGRAQEGGGGYWCVLEIVRCVAVGPVVASNELKMLQFSARIMLACVLVLLVF